MKRLFTLLGLFLASIMHAQSLYHTELLGRPTDHSITLQTFFRDSVEARVQYGTVSGLYTNATAWQLFADSVPVEITLNGLQANTKYFYRLNYRKPGSSGPSYRPEYTFQTQCPAGTSFTFTVQADPHLDEQSDTAIYRRCLMNQLEDQADFMIDLGDFLMTDKLRTPAKVVPHDTIPYRCNLLRSYYETACHSVPLFIALGNHEGEAGWYLNGTANNVAVWDAQERKKYFLNPYPDNFYTGDTSYQNYIGQRGNYYSWTWGDALFIVIDPYWYTTVKPDSLNGWRWTLGKVQYDWLRNTLEKSTAKFKFVFSHQIIGGDPEGRGGVEFADRYEWGGNNLNGTPGFAANRPGWYKPIKDLLEENRVTIFFHGHDHFFGKQDKRCLVYQETPQPSHPNFSSAAQAAVYGYLQGQILPNSGHLRVTVGPSGVKVEYVRAYKAADETNTRHNKDVSAMYFIGAKNCYDSLTTGVPVLWNSNYADELIFPNPFTRDIKIEFQVDREQELTLSITDSKGKTIRNITSGVTVPEGRYQFYWDGNDTNGNALPAGPYWLAIHGADGTSVIKKLIIKK